MTWFLLTTVIQIIFSPLPCICSVAKKTIFIIPLPINAFVVDENTEEFLPSLLSRLGYVYVTRGRVLNILLADVIKISYRAYC